MAAAPAKPGHIKPNLETALTFGKKKTSLAVATVTMGKGMIRVNGVPLHLVEPEVLRAKIMEPVLLIGQQKFSKIDIRIKVKGGGYVSQIYAIRQAIARGIVAFYQKYVDEAAKRKIKDLFLEYDRKLLVQDPRRTEPKKFGGHGARARKQKSYR